MPSKDKKTKEEKYAENYFPLSNMKETKYTVEKPVNSRPNKEQLMHGTIEKNYKKPDRTSLEIVEKVGNKKKVKKKKSKKGKKSSKKTNQAEKVINYNPERIKLKKEGYELIITEKPQAAKKISDALGKSTKKVSNKVSYYEVNRDGQEIIVACAVGHLLTLKQTTSGSQIPIFDIKWVPNSLAKKSDFTKRYYDTIKKLAKQAGSITIATDFDIEGEVIGLNILRYVCGQKDASRMKYSTLTDKELNNSYENKLQTIEWGQAIAGETRHFMDWYYGINLSRALMNAIKTTGRFKLMSIGRVQGPALKLIVDKEKKIQAFVPKPFWQPFITLETNEKEKVELKHNKDIFKKQELEKFENLEGKEAEAETTKKEQKIKPPLPFNLTTLQTEAYRFHGVSPSQTLRAAQSLYLAGVISYPRTSSQKLPASIAYKQILKKLAKIHEVEHLIKKEKPIEGKKSDPAHPSIYPTEQIPEKNSMNQDENKVYSLIVKRFLSLFCEEAIVDRKKIQALVKNEDKKENLKFSTKGMSIRKKAWMEIYPTQQKENQIPDLFGKRKIKSSRIEEKETQPPRRYTSASIISELEKRNLGTKATRSNIIETLFNRGYIEGKNVKATPIGISLIDTLRKYSDIIIDEQLTRHFEEEMESIRNATSNFTEKEKSILNEAKEAILKIANQFSNNQEKIGQQLLNANDKFKEQQKKENTLRECPKCKKGNLVITYSKKNKRQFVACDAYPECKNTYTLPPGGKIKKEDNNKLCEECKWPMLIRLAKGKRPWTFCFNPECPTNEEWVKKRDAKYNNTQNNNEEK